MNTIMARITRLIWQDKQKHDITGHRKPFKKMRDQCDSSPQKSFRNPRVEPDSSRTNHFRKTVDVVDAVRTSKKEKIENRDDYYMRFSVFEEMVNCTSAAYRLQWASKHCQIGRKKRAAYAQECHPIIAESQHAVLGSIFPAMQSGVRVWCAQWIGHHHTVSVIQQRRACGCRAFGRQLGFRGKTWI